jgi:hypothetical protein
LFGAYDFSIYSAFNQNNQSYFGFPTCFVDTTGKGFATFAGEKNFTAVKSMFIQ